MKIIIAVFAPFIALHFLFKWGITSSLYKNRDLIDLKTGEEELLDSIIEETADILTNYFDWLLCLLAFGLLLYVW